MSTYAPSHVGALVRRNDTTEARLEVYTMKKEEKVDPYTTATRLQSA